MPRSGRGARWREDEAFLPEAPRRGSEQGREVFGPRAEPAAELTVHFTARGEIGEVIGRILLQSFVLVCPAFYLQTGWVPRAPAGPRSNQSLILRSVLHREYKQAKSYPRLCCREALC